MTSFTAVIAATKPQPAVDNFGPGKRVLLDAHNSYPEGGKWADRIDRAIKAGTPLAIEQDLYWRREATGQYRAIVAHDSDQLVGAPTFEKYFFERVRPIMERALRENKRETWPLIVLNLDLKTNQRELHQAILSLLEQHDSWLTTATRSATPDTPSDIALNIGPMLVLCGQDPSQRADFHDAVAVGQKLRVFGATPVPRAPGATGAERTKNLSHMTVEATDSVAHFELCAVGEFSVERWSRKGGRKLRGHSQLPILRACKHS